MNYQKVPEIFFDLHLIDQFHSICFLLQSLMVVVDHGKLILSIIYLIGGSPLMDFIVPFSKELDLVRANHIHSWVGRSCGFIG